MLLLSISFHLPRGLTQPFRKIPPSPRISQQNEPGTLAKYQYQSGTFSRAFTQFDQLPFRNACEWKIYAPAGQSGWYICPISKKYARGNSMEHSASEIVRQTNPGDVTLFFLQCPGSGILAKNTVLEVVRFSQTQIGLGIFTDITRAFYDRSLESRT